VYENPNLTVTDDHHPFSSGCYYHAASGSAFILINLPSNYDFITVTVLVRPPQVRYRFQHHDAMLRHRIVCSLHPEASQRA